MNAREAYAELRKHSKELAVVGSINSLVGWDQQVNMPPRAVAHRASMSGFLEELIHRKATEPRVGELLAAAEAEPWADAEAANLREWRRDYDLATKLPGDLVRRRAELTTEATSAWAEARRTDNFDAFAPYLEQLVALSREVADLLGWQAERYDALLDQYEPGLTTAQCDAFFAELQDSVVPLLQRISASSVKPNRGLFQGATFPQEAQRALGLEITQALGFDYRAGRLDVAPHPFCSGFAPTDVRLTTRYDPQWPFQSLMGTIHESGHGMYDQGLSVDHYGTPLGEAVSLGIHESQSRFFENNIGRSRAFWTYWYPRFKEHFGTAAEHVGLDDLYLLVNEVRPSFIRVEADEVTYNLHIMVRFEVERDLFRDAVKVADLPDMWDAKYKEYLGITPPTRREGILQDVHWSWAYFGYFPTYSLGTVYAAQLEAALRRNVPDLDGQMMRGEFGAPLRWLRSNVHCYGKLYRPAELIEQATGKPPSASDYVTYLTHKYGGLYQL